MADEPKRDSYSSGQIGQNNYLEDLEQWKKKEREELYSEKAKLVEYWRERYENANIQSDRDFMSIVRLTDEIAKANVKNTRLAEALTWALSELDTLNEKHGQDEGINTQLGIARQTLKDNDR